MEDNKKETKETQVREKMSYEQLENVARQLHEQLQRAGQEIQRLNMGNVFQRLNYLFKVTKYSDKFSKEFVDKCVDEIESLLTIPEEEEAGVETEKV